MKKASLILVGILLGYILPEVLFSSYRYLFPPPPRVYSVFSRIDRTVRFDPVSGYRYTAIPSRVAQIADGKVDRITQFKGNNQGFSDRDDFYPERLRSGHASDSISQGLTVHSNWTRIAVLGDSFTGAVYLTESWPNKVEDESNGGLELLNFAQDGTGLANWWSIVTRLLVPEHYQLDGIVFAVYGDDLHRRFNFYQQRGLEFERYGVSDTWNPETFPPSLDSIRRREFRSSDRAFNLSDEDFERALRGEWKPPVHREFKLHLADIAMNRLFPPPPGIAADTLKRDSADPDRKRLMSDIRAFLESQKLRSMVVYVPNRAELLGERRESTVEEASAFASAIGAGQFVDGRDAFAGLTPKEISANWLRHDLHWNQQGSDRFAGFMLRKLSGWNPLRP